jgi:hypothetical protein
LLRLQSIVLSSLNNLLCTRASSLKSLRQHSQLTRPFLSPRSTIVPDKFEPHTTIPDNATHINHKAIDKKKSRKAEEEKKLRKTTLVLRQNKQVIMSSRKPICIPYLAREKDLKRRSTFKNLCAENLRLETKKGKDDVSKTNQGSKSIKKRVKMLGCLVNNL